MDDLFNKEVFIKNTITDDDGREGIVIATTSTTVIVHLHGDQRPKLFLIEEVELKH